MEYNPADVYYTIEKAEIAEIKIKGSKFIGYAAPAPTREAAMEFLESIRAKHFDATHNCYAFKIGKEGNDFRFSDDGEPNGTAGKPILYTFTKFDLSDIIVVVTRYFGGTKLGVGGLVRAYSDASEAVLELCQKKIIHCTTPVEISCTYENINIVKRLLSQYAISLEEDYTDTIYIIAHIHNSRAQAFCDEMSRVTNTKVVPTILK